MVWYQNSSVAAASQVLEASREGGHNLSRQRAPLLASPHSEEVSPYVQSEHL